ncbi:putative glutathione S-transferase [Xylariaceae sp. FL0255]|nr:putative glutathione S-transferase [Xylariaceae sp. FL0255]
MASEKIIFFDLGSNGPKNRAWSYNPWKTRFVLNYKGLDYETKWLEYPEIKPTIKPHIPVAEDDHYTIPAVKFPDGTYMMESFDIATRIEKEHPEPPLHLDAPIFDRLRPLTMGGQSAIRPIVMTQVYKRLLKESNWEYWKKTRFASIDMPIEQYEKEFASDDTPYKNAAPHFSKISELLHEDESGPFFMGKTVCYTDFVWGSVLLFYRRIGEDVFEKVLEATGDRDVHLKLLEGLKPWSERDDH